MGFMKQIGAKGMIPGNNIPQGLKPNVNLRHLLHG